MARSLLLVAALILFGLATSAFVDPFSRDVLVAGQPEPAHAPEIRWRVSRALGVPASGRLVAGVQLPAEGETFFTWDPVLHRSPDRGWRRWGTDRLLQLVLTVSREYAAAHPGAPRLGIGDLSRPHGGPFGPKHATHQNGLDADVYYPRLDGLERPPERVAQIDIRLAQDLVDRFVRAGVDLVYVGPNTGLRGPPGVVQVLWNHDNHVHVRIYNRPGGP